MRGKPRLMQALQRRTKDVTTQNRHWILAPAPIGNGYADAFGLRRDGARALAKARS